MTYKVLYVNPLRDYIDGLLAAAPDDMDVTIRTLDAGVDELCREAEQADFILSGIDVPEAVFRAARKVKFIQYLSSGYGQLPVSVLDELGVPVAQMKTHSISVAEHAVTLVLTLLRRIPASVALLRDGKWRPDLDETSYAELYGKTVGIIGLGNIGRWIGKVVSHGFGANVVFYDDADIPLTVSELIPAQPLPLDELLRISDVVCMSVPLNDASRRLIGADELRLMKRSAVLINVGRGETVDQAALTDALREERIAGAGLDVYESEPLDLDSELLRMDRVVTTPHMAGVGWENVQRRIDAVWRNIDTVLHGGTPIGVVTTTRRATEPVGSR